MKVCTSFLLVGIFAHISLATRIKVDHRGLNPAQENVSKLTNEEYSEDNKDLDNVHNFITSKTTATETNKNKNRVLKAARVKTFTDFIQEAVKILNTYEDTAFEDFFHILEHEIRRYHYRDCKFSELTQNPDTRNLLAWALIIIRGKSVSFSKANINEMADMMRDKTYGNEVTELLDYINSLYRHNELKFNRVLKELKHYRKTKSIKTHNNLVKVIRQGVRDIFFDHYTALDSNTRQELKVKIEKFWNRFKNNHASSAEVNNSHGMNAVNESVIDSIKVSKNVMNEDKDPKFKNDPQTNLRNKRDRKSKENYYQQPPDKETEKDDSSNESENRNTNTATTDEISSGQSFDSSSNSIKQSQERHAEYNSERYMTLYTEKIYYKARTTKKTEIIQISANEMSNRATVPRRQTITSTPRYSLEEEQKNTKKVEVLSNGQDLVDTKQGVNDVMVKSKAELRARKDDENQRKRGKLDKSKSKSKHKNTHFIGEYNAVIDVQLANTELLKSLGIFKPVPDKNSRYNTTLYRRSFKETKPVPKEPMINSRAMRTEPKLKKPTALTNPPSRYPRTYKSNYRKPLDSLMRNISTLLFNESKIAAQLIKGKKRQRILLSRRNANNTVSARDFNKDVIKRIDALERDLHQLKQIVNVKSKKYDNYTDKYNAKDKTGQKRNITLKYDVVRLMKEYKDMNKKEFNTTNNYGNSTISIESTTKNTTYYKQSVLNNDVANTTVIDDKNISQVTMSNVIDTNAISEEEKNDNNETTVTVSSVKVTETTEREPFVTTAGVTAITEGYSEPPVSLYYGDDDPDQNPFQRNGQVDPFGHINDGLNINNYGI